LFQIKQESGIHQYTWIGDHIKYCQAQISEYVQFIKGFFQLALGWKIGHFVVYQVWDRICSRADSYFVQEF
jgi:hypothetical protein